MIRRDYIMRMIAEFIEAWNRLQALKKGQKWSEAKSILDAEFERLVGAGAEVVGRMSETELLAQIIRGEPTQVVRDKTLILTALLQEAGEAAAARGEEAQNRAFRLKALHLLLGVLAEGEVSDCPEFVPKVEALRAALDDASLPLETLARLMQHYEHAGHFAKAEDALFAMVDRAEAHPGLLEFGNSFYDRLARHTDPTLAAGNLPRSEVEAGRAELQSRFSGAK